MTDADALSHVVRLALAGKRRDVATIALRMARRWRRRDRADEADALHEILRAAAPPPPEPDPVGEPAYHRLAPVPERMPGGLVTAACISCSLCRTIIAASGGPGRGAVCNSCAAALRDGRLSGAVEWPTDLSHPGDEHHVAQRACEIVMTATDTCPHADDPQGETPVRDHMEIEDGSGVTRHRTSEAWVCATCGAMHERDVREWTS